MPGDFDFLNPKSNDSPWGGSDRLPPAIDTHGGTGMPALDRLPTYQNNGTNSAADKILGNFKIGGLEEAPAAGKSPWGEVGVKLSSAMAKVSDYVNQHLPSDSADDTGLFVKSALSPLGKVLTNVRVSPKDSDGFDRMDAELAKPISISDIGNGVSIKANQKFGFASKLCDDMVSVKDIVGLQIMNGEKVIGDIKTGRLLNIDGKTILKANLVLPTGQRQVVDIPLTDTVAAAARAL